MIIYSNRSKSSMKTINTILLIVGFACITSVSGEVSSENARALDDLSKMSKQITQDFPGFLNSLDDNRWAFPEIYSAWYVSKMSDDGKKSIAQAARDFGLLLSEGLTTLAAKVRASTEPQDLEDELTQLLKAKKWIEIAPSSYGSLFLLDRVHDIACIAIIKLVGNMDYPAEKYQKYIDELNWNWASAELRREVLMSESNGKFFNSPHDSTQAVLIAEWHKNLSNLKANPTPQSEALAFFLDDKRTKMMNVGLPETCWNQKLHFKVVEGFDTVHYESLLSLATFRKRYGHFPLKPKTYRKTPDETDIEAAFWELSWKNSKEVSGAWLTYSKLLNGTLADEGELYHRDKKN
jgi:hypothetical protein